MYGSARSLFTPVPSKAGICSSPAADSSCTKPFSMEEPSRCARHAAHSSSVSRRPSSGKRPASPQGVYWAIREKSTSPGAKLSLTQSMTFRVLAVWPGSARWRMSTPERSIPSSSKRQGPAARNMAAMAALATAG